jgi:hypothetical protein
MTREIDILMQVTERGGAAVEKSSHVLWDGTEFPVAREAGHFPDEDCLVPATAPVDVSGPFPGCVQQFSAAPDYSHYRLVGQTRHFWIFDPPPAGR